MDEKLFEKLHREGHLSDASLDRVKAAAAGRLFSLHWELKTLLYLGVLLLSGGLGTLIYRNLDTIGHMAVILLIAAVSIGCFVYCFRHRPPFSWHKVLTENAVFDYVLLLGCLTLISFITYLQAQYGVFGQGYGASTFIPMLVLFFSAYYFDHLGVLSLAITNLAAWMGIALTPTGILSENDFGDSRLIFTGILLGAILIGAGYLSRLRDLKQHFFFTYCNFGVHILYIALIAAQLHFENSLWVLPVAGITALFLWQARKEHSFYFILICVLYSYISLSIVVLNNYHYFDLVILMLYFLCSAIGISVFLTYQYKNLKKDARI
jgi:hypothetical protein